MILDSVSALAGLGVGGVAGWFWPWVITRQIRKKRMLKTRVEVWDPSSPIMTVKYVDPEPGQVELEIAGKKVISPLDLGYVSRDLTTGQATVLLNAETGNAFRPTREGTDEITAYDNAILVLGEDMKTMAAQGQQPPWEKLAKIGLAAIALLIVGFGIMGFLYWKLKEASGT